MMIRVNTLVFMIIVCFTTCKVKANNVTFVATLFRHGDRTPISFYPTDPWADRKWWPVNFGQLTEKGMLQHYELGLKFREEYGHLLSKVYDSNEIYIRSTDFDRTIMSALSNLAGLYKVDPANEFVPGLMWKPVPIRSFPGSVDYVLGQKAPCPRYDWELSKFTKSKYFKDIYIKYIPLFKYLKEHTGKNIVSLLDASYIYDVLLIEESYNYTLPNWTAAVYPDLLKNVSQDSISLETHTPEMKRLKGGPLVKELIGFMDGVVDNSSSYKFLMYSAHDTTIVTALNSLGMFDFELPPYAAHVVFELLSPDSTIPEHTVRIKYQGEILDIPNCGKLCPLSQFKENYKWLIPDDHETDCQLKIYQTNHWNLVGGIVFLLVIFCLICAAVVVFRTQNNSRYLPCNNAHVKILTPGEPSEK